MTLVQKTIQCQRLYKILVWILVHSPILSKVVNTGDTRHIHWFEHRFKHRFKHRIEHRIEYWSFSEPVFYGYFRGIEHRAVSKRYQHGLDTGLDTGPLSRLSPKSEHCRLEHRIEYWCRYRRRVRYGITTVLTLALSTVYPLTLN